jgi:hypothetical protein
VTVAVVEPPLPLLTVKSVPVPESEIVCGLPAASSTIVRDALRVPVAVGLNVTVSVHVSALANVDEQPLPREKSELLEPVRAMLVKFIKLLPVFVMERFVLLCLW